KSLFGVCKCFTWNVFDGLNIVPQFCVRHFGDLPLFYLSRAQGLRLSRQYFLFGTAIQAFLRAPCARQSDIVILTLQNQYKPTTIQRLGSDLLSPQSTLQASAFSFSPVNIVTLHNGV